MQTDVLVVGGGLSGLSAVWRLQSAGIDASVLEARTRFGGRICTARESGEIACDLGPSWFWPGQPLIARLLQHFDMPYYEQFADGSVLFQMGDGRVERIAEPSPMRGARRVQGGMGRITERIASQIDVSHRFLAHRVTGLSICGDGVVVDAIGPSGTVEVQAQQVALAIPPRLARDLVFAPALPVDTVRLLAATPTWMAGHAKFFAIYDKPFWRNEGLCGTAMSQCGPLSEIHDASADTERGYSLFGFSGLDATSRADMGRDEFIQQATAQLAVLFGDEARQPQGVYLQDWSGEQFTAHAADLNAPTRHPQYGLSLDVGREWEGKLAFISTETSFSNGGLLEGALEASLKFTQRIVESDAFLDAAPRTPRAASMSWDWL